MKDSLEAQRQKLEALDKELARLLCERMQVSRALVSWKKLQGFDVSDPAREAQITARARQSCSVELDKSHMDAMYQILFKAAKTAVKPSVE